MPEEEIIQVFDAKFDFTVGENQALAALKAIDQQYDALKKKVESTELKIKMGLDLSELADASTILEGLSKKARVEVSTIPKAIEEAVKKSLEWFKWLKDEVVGKSVIPEMVRSIEIWLERMRLDSQSQIEIIGQEWIAAAKQFEEASQWETLIPGGFTPVVEQATIALAMLQGKMENLVASGDASAKTLENLRIQLKELIPLSEIAAKLDARRTDVQKALVAAGVELEKQGKVYIANLEEARVALEAYRQKQRDIQEAEALATQQKREYVAMLREQAKIQSSFIQRVQLAFAGRELTGLTPMERIDLSRQIEQFELALETWRKLEAQIKTGHQATLETVADFAQASNEVAGLGKQIEEALDTRIFYSASEAAQQLGISVNQVVSMLRRGEMEGLRTGAEGRWLIMADQMERATVSLKGYVTAQQAAQVVGKDLRVVHAALEQAQIKMIDVGGRQYTTMQQVSEALVDYKTKTQQAADAAVVYGQKVLDLTDNLYLERQRLAAAAEKTFLGTMFEPEQIDQVAGSVARLHEWTDRLTVGSKLLASGLNEPLTALRGLRFMLGGVSEAGSTQMRVLDGLVRVLTYTSKGYDHWQRSLLAVSRRLEDSAIQTEFSTSAVVNQFKAMRESGQITQEQMNRVVIQLRRGIRDYRGYATEIRKAGEVSEQWTARYLKDLDLARGMLQALSLEQDENGRRIVDVNNEVGTSIKAMLSQIDQQAKYVHVATELDKKHRAELEKKKEATDDLSAATDRATESTKGFLARVRESIAGLFGFRRESEGIETALEKERLQFDRTGRSSTTFARNLHNITAVLSGVGSAFGQLGSEVDQMVDGALRASGVFLDAFEDMADGTETNVQRIRTALGSLMIAVGAISAGIIVSWGKVAMEVETAWITLETIAINVGVSMDYVRGKVEDMRDAGITTREAVEGMTQMLRAGLPIENIRDFARAAQNLAASIGVDSSQAFKQFIKFVQTGNTQLLDFLKINTTATQMIEQWAKANDVAVDDMTNYQKALAYMNGLMDEAAKLTGVYEKAMTTANKQLGSMRRYVEELKLEFGERFLPILTTVVMGVNKVLNAFRDLPDVIKDITAGLVVLSVVVGTFLGLLLVLPSPISAIIIVVTALVAALTILSKMIDENVAGLGDFAEGVGKAFQTFLEGVASDLLWWASQLGRQVEELMGHLQRLGETVFKFSEDNRGLAQTLKTVRDAINGIMQAISFLIEGMNAIMRGDDPWIWLQKAAKSALASLVLLFDNIIAQAATWGWNLIVEFANGIADAFAATLGPILTEIGKYIQLFLGAFSAPKKGPLRHIAEWGKNLIDTYLRAFGLADFSVLDKLLRPIERALEDAVALGNISETLASDLLEGTRKSLAQLLAQLRETGTFSEEIIRDIAEALGEGSEELVKFIRLQAEYLASQREVTDLERQIKEVARTKGFVPREMVRALEAAKEEVEQKKEQVAWQQAYLEMQQDINKIQEDMASKMGGAARKMAKAAKTIAEAIKGIVPEYPKGGAEREIKMPSFITFGEDFAKAQAKVEAFFEALAKWVDMPWQDKLQSLADEFYRLTGIDISFLIDDLERMVEAGKWFVDNELAPWFADLGDELTQLDFSEAIGTLAEAFEDLRDAVGLLFGDGGDWDAVEGGLGALAGIAWVSIKLGILGVVSSLDDLVVVTANIIKGGVNLFKLLVAWIKGDEESKAEAIEAINDVSGVIVSATFDAISEQFKRAAEERGRLELMGFILPDATGIQKEIDEWIEAIKPWKLAFASIIKALSKATDDKGTSGAMIDILKAFFATQVLPGLIALGFMNEIALMWIGGLIKAFQSVNLNDAAQDMVGILGSLFYLTVSLALLDPEGIREAAGMLVKWIDKLWKEVEKPFIQNFVDGMIAALKNLPLSRVVIELIDAGQSIVDGLLLGIELGWPLFLIWLETQIRKIITKFWEVLGLASESKETKIVGEAIVAGLTSGIDGKWLGFLAFITTKAQSIIDTIKVGLGWDEGTDLPGYIVDVGKAIVRGLQKGIENTWAAFVEWFMGKIQGLLDAIFAVWQKGSPSQVMVDLGEGIVGGLSSGVMTTWGTFSSYLLTQMTTLLGTLTTMIVTFTSEASLAWSSLGDTIETSVLARIRSLVTLIVEGVNPVMIATMNYITEVAKPALIDFKNTALFGVYDMMTKIRASTILAGGAVRNFIDLVDPIDFGAITDGMNGVANAARAARAAVMALMDAIAKAEGGILVGQSPSQLEDGIRGAVDAAHLLQDAVRGIDLGQAAINMRYLMPAAPQAVGPSYLNDMRQYTMPILPGGSVRSERDIIRIVELVMQRLREDVGQRSTAGTMYGVG